MKKKFKKMIVKKTGKNSLRFSFSGKHSDSISYVSISTIEDAACSCSGEGKFTFAFNSLK